MSAIELSLTDIMDKLVVDDWGQCKGGMFGSLYAVGLAYLGSRSKGAELASGNAAYIMLYSTGMLAGPPLIGFIAQRYTLLHALTVVIPLLLLAGAIAGALRRPAQTG